MVKFTERDLIFSNVSKLNLLVFKYDKSLDLVTPTTPSGYPEDDFSVASEDDISVQIRKPPEAFSDRNVVDEPSDEKLDEAAETDQQRIHLTEEKFPENLHVDVFEVAGFGNGTKVLILFLNLHFITGAEKAIFSIPNVLLVTHLNQRIGDHL